MRFILIRNILKSIVIVSLITGIVGLMIQERIVPPARPEHITIAPFKKEEITARAIAYTPKESKEALNENIPSHGYQPIQITVQNNSAKTYILSEADVDLPLVDPSKIAARISLGAIPRNIALKVLGFIFWPFIIPATIDSIISFKSHFNRSDEFYIKSLKERGEWLPPYSTMHRIFFIPKDVKADRFELHIKEHKGSYKTLIVQID